MVVIKFGGTSVIDASRMDEVYALVLQSKEKEDTVVVLSAMKGTTEVLIESASSAVQGGVLTEAKGTQLGYKQLYENIYTRHRTAWNELVKNTKGTDKQELHVSLPKPLEEILDELAEILHGVSLIKECTDRTRDLILSFGERLSCNLFAHYLNDCKNVAAEYVDARDYIVTNNQYGSAGVLFEETYQNLNTHIKKILKKGAIPIVTGFIGATKEKITTTLGRNGSDYTASLLGAALHADRIEIWTDVDGVLSADPRIEPSAYVLPQVSYKEAMELSYFGAKVIHPQAVVPAVERKVPIIIKNTLNPTAKGTFIHSATDIHKSSITGLASVSSVSLLTIEGAGLTGNFYFLPDVFGVFAANHVHPLMITQSSSEHSISFILNADDAPKIKVQLDEKFADELARKKIQDISVLVDKSIISVIGSNMRGITGLSGKIFSAMGDAHINVIAIAQGSNEMNISFVIEKSQERNAIQVLHKKFF